MVETEGQLKNSHNNSKMADNHGTLDSRLVSRLSYLSLIHQFYDPTNTQLKSRPCAIRLINECQIGTPIPRS